MKQSTILNGLFFKYFFTIIVLLGSNAFAQNASTWIPASQHSSKAYFCDTLCGVVVNVTYNPTNFGQITVRSVNFKYEIRYPSNIIFMLTRNDDIDSVVDFVMRGNVNYLQSIDFEEYYVRRRTSNTYRGDFVSGETSFEFNRISLNEIIRNKISAQIFELIRTTVINIRQNIQVNSSGSSGGGGQGGGGGTTGDDRQGGSGSGSTGGYGNGLWAGGGMVPGGAKKIANSAYLANTSQRKVLMP